LIFWRFYHEELYNRPTAPGRRRSGRQKPAAPPMTPDDLIVARYEKSILQLPHFILPSDYPAYLQPAFDDIRTYMAKNEKEKMHLEFLIEDLRFRLAKLEKVKK